MDRSVQAIFLGGKLHGSVAFCCVFLAGNHDSEEQWDKLKIKEQKRAPVKR